MKNKVSVLLKKKAKTIMALWQKRAKKELFEQLDQTNLALRDSLPEYLIQMADALSKSIDRTTKRKKDDKAESLRVGTKHGSERRKFANYSIDQLIFEFHILRESIFQVLEEKEEVPKDARDIILNSIEQIVNDAATEFSESARDFQEHFAVTVTHDLRTPIAAAKMSAQLILRQSDTSQVIGKLASRIVENMSRVDDMVQDLLDSSRLRSGKKLELSFEKLDLSRLTTDVCMDLNALYDNRIKVISESSVVGKWNKRSLWRILENLINNAVKYGREDKEIAVKLEKKRSRAIFSVHNFGNPIPIQHRAKLFEKFERSDEMKTNGGWGIGLSVVKGIVETHKGKVWIESTKAKGTTFFVELPIDFAKIKQEHLKLHTESTANL